MPGAATAFPWLTRDTPGQPPERIELDDFPFVLGRNESCDFQILSSRVSREHAEIVRDGGGFKVRDLASTNGTFVNGQRVDEVRLADGDLVVIADIEFCFSSGQPADVRKVVTQVMDAGGAGEEAAEDHAGRDLIHAVRALHESLLTRAVRNRFQPIVELEGNRCVGYEALFAASRPRRLRPSGFWPRPIAG